MTHTPVSDTERCRELHIQVQKSFKIVLKCIAEWKTVVSDCQDSVKSLENYTEQYQCCCNVSELSIEALINRLPDIKDKLLFKIQIEAEKHLSTLNTKL